MFSHSSYHKPTLCEGRISHVPRRQSCNREVCPHLVLSAGFFLLASLAQAQNDNWVGTTGAWSDPTHWDSGVPVAGDNIVIGTASANSTDDFGLAIGTLTLSNSADSLTIADGVALNVSGTINNAGSIQLASAGSNTYLLVTGNISLFRRRKADSGYNRAQLHSRRVGYGHGGSDQAATRFRRGATSATA